MYSPNFAMNTAARAQHPAGAYHQVGVQTTVATATPHQLVSLLFDALFLAISRARAAVEAGDVASKVHHVGHAMRIVDEGLRSALNIKEGGKLAQDLSDLYDYIELRLTQANVRSDVGLLTECLDLMKPLRDAWAEIAP